LVDLAEIQAAYYMVAATGVLVAAGYYIMILREQTRSRRLTQTNTLMQQIRTLETSRTWIELMNMQWSDYDDFEKKYGSDFNAENFAKRNHMWTQYDTIGNLLEAGILDRESVYRVLSFGASWLWAKFKPIIEENRKRYSGRDYMYGFEYLAGEMMKMKLERDPTYKVPETFAKYVPNK
jgi:hypothetical protein